MQTDTQNPNFRAELHRQYRSVRRRLNCGLIAKPKRAPASGEALTSWPPVPDEAIVTPKPDPVILYLYPIGPSKPRQRGDGVARDILHVASPPTDDETATARELMRRFCRTRGVKLTDIQSSRRTQDIIPARQELMWILRTRTKKSLPEIGRLIGGRDHTTVLHGVHRHEQRLRAGLTPPTDW